MPGSYFSQRLGAECGVEQGLGVGVGVNGSSIWFSLNHIGT